MKSLFFVATLFVCSTLSAQETEVITEDWKVSCYPNPTSDLLVIESSEEIKSVTLINLNGEVIKSGALANWCYSLSEIPAGWVFVYIENQEGEIIKKNVFKTE